jgi:peroxiredoxin
VVSDVTSEVLKKYRLWFAVPQEIKELYRDKFGINLDKHNGKGRWELPVPATYVLDGQGVVRAGVADPDHTVRMDIEEILSALKSIREEK